MEGSDIAFVGAIASMVFTAACIVAIGLIETDRLSIVLDGEALTADGAGAAAVAGGVMSPVLLVLSAVLNHRRKTP